MDYFLLGRKLFDQTFSLIEKSLDLRSLRQKILASNIANVATPDYHPREVPFHKILRDSMGAEAGIQLKRTHPKHLAEQIDTGSELEVGEGAVDIDKEMMKLAENNMMFQAGVQSLVKKFEALRFTITDTGR